MPDDPIDPGAEPGAPPPPRPPHVRRPRYPGTHPRSFQERYKELDPERFPKTAEHVRAQGRTPAGTHVPILVAEVLEVLAPKPGETVADLTVGYGGHAKELAARVGETGRLLAFDHDEATLAATAARWPSHGLLARTTFHAVHHAALPEVLAREGIDGCDVVLADLGVSSMQIDDPSRGFSYKRNGPLDMRMDRRRKRTAADVVATIDERALSEALSDLSNEPRAQTIAAAIVKARSLAPLVTTRALADVVLAVCGTTRAKYKREAHDASEPHPAARTFQALRMLVNDESAGLERLLRALPWCLRPGGRVAILSFHSGEDRRVKRAFRDGLDAGLYDAVAEDIVRADPQEVAANPRASSAKLRWARRARAPATETPAGTLS